MVSDAIHDLGTTTTPVPITNAVGVVQNPATREGQDTQEARLLSILSRLNIDLTALRDNIGIIANVHAPNRASFSFLQQNVATVGTPVNLPALIIPNGFELLIKARAGNTGIITVGNSSPNALNTATANIRLRANDAVVLRITNANLVWIDSTVAGQGIEYGVET